MSKNNINSFLNKFYELYSQIEDICCSEEKNDINRMILHRKNLAESGDSKDSKDYNEPVLLIKSNPDDGFLYWSRFKFWRSSYKEMTETYHEEPIGIFYGTTFLYITNEKMYDELYVAFKKFYSNEQTT